MAKVEEGQKPKRSRAKAGAKRGDKEKRGRDITLGSFVLRLAINGAIILILGLIAAVAVHFLLQSSTRHGIRRTVPNIHTLTIEEAERAVESHDLKLVINDSLYAPTVERGTILDQLPEEGTIVKPGRTIYVTINATQLKMVDIPYVAGRSLRQAKNMLEVAGLTIERLDYQRDLATNYILSQSYRGADVTATSALRAPVGSGVTLTVGASEEQEQTVMPLLIGSSIHVAKSALWSAGLNVKAVKYEDGISESDSKLAVVVEQSFPADSLLKLGREISFKLSLDQDKVTQYFKEKEEVLKLRAEMEEMEQAMLDSLSLIAPDTTEVAPQRPRAERVDFEDLFN
ncbi:MAG: PASTA domain-containing protein [Rikenellaceae bacterium]